MKQEGYGTRTYFYDTYAMKILFILDNYWPFKGGAETLFKNLAEGLAAKGQQVTVLTRKVPGSKSHEILNGVEIHRMDAANRYVYSFKCIGKAVALARNADIIHTTTFASAAPAFIASLVSGRPAVITVHEVWTGKWKEYTDVGEIRAAILNFMEWCIYRIPFDRYVCVSESTKRQLKKPNSTVIYNGVDYSHFNPRHKGTDVRKKLGLGKSFVCLTYGRAAPSKGIEYAAMAVEKAKIANLKWAFIITPDYSDRYSRVKNMLEKSSRAILIPPVSHDRLPDYIAAADCVVVPSLAEGFGYVAAEACAMGKPVVASNTTSLPEIVSGKYVLAEPRNPESIAAAVEQVHKGKYTKSRPRKFSIEENIKRHLELYRELIKN
ncbi:glycosyltransferase family 4 protein [Candidatus Woesearchaeota archaeon]|nr:glycosyltransferase family 4 protein [Candidatus Woesearchaeota archaeon]